MPKFKLLVFLSLLMTPALVSQGEKSQGEKRVLVFVLAGQSNMEGKAQNKLWDHQAIAPETKGTFSHLRDKSGWVVREDVFIDFLKRRGQLTLGFGSPGRTGVELEFGTVLGNRYDVPVLLIKTAWGGRAIAKKFRPPSAGMRDDVAIERALAQLRRRDKDATREDVTKTYGENYRSMIAKVKDVTTNLDKLFPKLAGHTPELRGFVWFQGWNDQYDHCHAEYASNLRHLIRDVRRDLEAPKLPVVVAAMGQNGSKEAKGPMKTIQEAQLAVETLDEFRGNVRSIRTDVHVDKAAEELYPRWRKEGEKWERTGSDHPYHYLGSAIWHIRIGKAMADAMLDLIDTDVHNLLTRAITNAQAKKFRDALPLLHQVLDQVPHHREALRWRGHCHTGLGMHAEALKDFDQLVGYNDGSAWAWYARGMAKHNLQQPKLAIEDYTRALEVDRAHFKALQWRGFTHAKLGDHLGAYADYSRALELQPANAWLYGARARAELALGSYDRARRDFEAAIRIDPARAADHAQLGYLLVAVSEDEAALASLTRSLALADDPYAKLWRFWLLKRLGKPSHAAEKKLPAKGWHGWITRTLTADTEPGLEEAKTLFAGGTVSQFHSEKDFYLGVRALLRGDIARAMKQMRAVVIRGESSPEARVARRFAQGR